ncbi:uncharacterized protein LOC113644534 [Tachysurus ichikawai]
MAAVPSGPGSGSRAEMISFPGIRRSVPGELETISGKLQDSGMTDTGQTPDVCGCKLDPFSEQNQHCETFVRQINGFSCIGLSGFIHDHKQDESLNELQSTSDHCDRSNSDPNTSNPEHKLGLSFYLDVNQKTDNSQTHGNIGRDLGIKVTKCYLRTDQGPAVAYQTVCDADGPVLAMCRLNLNRSPPATEETQSQDVVYVHYESELQMPGIMRLITKDLSEPYSIYTYRYFIHNWPQLCFLAMVQEVCVGAIVCKLDMHKKMFRRGYIAMLAVDSEYRRKNIGTNLVKKAINAMVEGACDEVVLETEITNNSALKLYENLGFVRDKRLFRYYLNGVDALRLKLWLR